MKKIILPLVLALAVSFVGCKKAEQPAAEMPADQQQPAAAPAADQATPAAPAADQPAQGK